MRSIPVKPHFEEFLENQVKPTKPTRNDLKWAKERFSSRAEPPKS